VFFNKEFIILFTFEFFKVSKVAIISSLVISSQLDHFILVFKKHSIFNKFLLSHLAKSGTIVFVLLSYFESDLYTIELMYLSFVELFFKGFKLGTCPIKASEILPHLIAVSFASLYIYEYIR